MTSPSAPPTSDNGPREMKLIAGDVEFSWSVGTIEQVHREWEAEHPGQVARAGMTGDEFATRMLVKLKASARKLPTGHA